MIKIFFIVVVSIIILCIFSFIHKLESFDDDESYIFAYGSLVNDNSLISTLFHINLHDESINALEKIVPNSEIMQNSIQTENKLIPCRIKGIKRQWNFSPKQTDNFITKPTLYLSADFAEYNYTCNGVLIPVSKSELDIIDKRETGYIKKEIRMNNVIAIGNQTVDVNKKIFFYAYENNNKINYNEIPIVQSYIDLCMNGFIQIDRKLKNQEYQFTNEFVDTTYGWDKSKWINDRIYPYRPHIFTPNASIIDKILSSKLNSFQIKILYPVLWKQ